MVLEQTTDPEQALAAKQMTTVIERCLAELPERQRQVIEWRFGFEDQKTLQQIGEIFGVHRECIRQIEAKALRKLKHPKFSKQLREVSPFGRAALPAPNPWHETPAVTKERWLEARRLIVEDRARRARERENKAAYLIWFETLTKLDRAVELMSVGYNDFLWPFEQGLSPQQAVAFALEFDSKRSIAEREALCQRIADFKDDYLQVAG